MRIARLVAALAIIAGLAVALVAVNVAGRDDDTEVGAPQPGPTRTTAPPPGPTATADESPLAVPTPDTTGRDFDRIYREIIAFQDWLWRHPEAELLELVIHPDCPCYQEGVTRLAELEERGLHFDKFGLDIESVTVVEDFSDLVRLEVVATQPALTLYDSSEEVVETVGDEGPATFSIVLVGEGSDRWRVRSVTQVEGS